MTMTNFTNTTYPLSTLLAKMARGEIALAPAGRPYRWDRDQIRDLFDSMYRGYPIGQFILWAAGDEGSASSDDEQGASTPPRNLVVDGRQRLTSLYCILKGEELPKSRYNRSGVQVAFRPRDEAFEVARMPIADNPEYIPDISVIWDGDSQASTKRNFLNRLEADSERLTEEEQSELIKAIDRLFDLRNYPISVLQLGYDVSKEQVADMFIRVNGKRDDLDSEDEIFARMSVWWEDCRTLLEAFEDDARNTALGPSPANPDIKPDAIDMLRVVTGLAFRRIQLADVYEVLRNEAAANDETEAEGHGEFSAKIKAAQNEALCLTNWHEFLRAIRRAGFRTDRMVCTENTLVAYLVFLIGRTDYQLDHQTLREVMAPWFFMTVLTDRYERGGRFPGRRRLSETRRRRLRQRIEERRRGDQQSGFSAERLARLRRHLDDDFGDRHRHATTNETVLRRARSISSYSRENRVEHDLVRIAEAVSGDDFIAVLNEIMDECLTEEYWAAALPESVATGGGGRIDDAYHASLILLNARPLLASVTMGELLDAPDRKNGSPYEGHSIFSDAYLARTGRDRSASWSDANTTYVQWPDNVEIKHSPPDEYLPLLFECLAPEEQEAARYWHALPEDWEDMDYPEFLQKRSILMAGVIRRAFNELRAGRVPD